MTVRAKFKCTEIVERHYGKIYKFFPVMDDGTPENQRYNKYTPNGSLEIEVNNPNVQFEIEKFYYLDFNEVPEE